MIASYAQARTKHIHVMLQEQGSYVLQVYKPKSIVSCKTALNVPALVH